ncbi:hypothetical protein [Shimia biformata]|uniref:hypothetical protein n=1 Tax=Shimia biformata TaxID=1294299 RepID=UPI00194EAD05|nr:hypothetical protein [Shimia biformata]
MDILLNKAFELEARIANATGDTRYQLHQDLHRTLERIKADGGRVPARLRDLDFELVDEELEGMFDNMPV